MDVESWQRVRNLFDQLVGLPPDQWSSALTALGVEDTVLRADVLAMLQADQSDLLKTSLAGQVPDVLENMINDADDQHRQSLAGRRVGAFRLLREIGQGGMGTVWLAERVDGQFRQQVAIKLIRGGWDAANVLARFRAERQILANLTHPNIARLVDGGVVDGDRPWLALEYVDGIDIVRYCDENRLSLVRRLRLFLTACDAVSHAHAHLIVHRDLKPSNLLVTASGELKLLDFGIAKLIGDSGETATATRIFTPEYAAPEQIQGGAMTTAVDVYALGMLLFELLAGRRPYRTSTNAPGQYELAITTQEPSRPSGVVTRSGDGDSAIALALRRDLTPTRLRRELRGDLDAIVLKALRKEPAQRYASVADMAVDIGNYLERRPVVARKGGWRYRAQRFVRRYAVAISLGVLAVVGLACGLVLALWQANEARLQRDIARSESDKATQSLEFLLDVFRSVDPAQTQGRKVTADELLARGVDRIDNRSFDSAVQYDLLLAMGEAYLGIGDSDEAHRLFQQAMQLQESAYPSDPLRRVRLLVLLSRSAGRADNDDAAGRYLDEAERLLPEDAADTETAADLNVSRGIYLINRGRVAEAIDHLAPGVAALQRLRGIDDSMAISAANVLAWGYEGLDRNEEARAVLMPIIEVLRAAPDDNPVRLADALDALANTYGSGEEADAALAMRQDALAITRRIYGDGHPFVQIRMNNMAFSLMSVHDYAGANRMMKEVVARDRATEKPGSSRIGSSVNNLASTEYALGHWAEAERLWNEAIAIRRPAGDATDTAFSLTGAAAAAREQGRLHDARERIVEALAMLRAHDAPKPTHLARTLIEYTEIDLAEGRVDCTRAEEAVAVLHDNAGPDDPLRLYGDVVASGCAWRLDASVENRARLMSALSALRAALPAGVARLRQAQRYAPKGT